MAISSARQEAFEVLLRIEKEGAYSSVLLAEVSGSMDERDRALCHEITLGTLRTRMFLDAILAKLSSKPLKKLDAEVLTALRMALYQLIHLVRVPDHAVVNDSVSLVVRSGKRSAKGFVNAILRNHLRGDVRLRFDDPVEELSVTGSHPRWLLERWIERFGLEETRRLVEFNNSRPPQDLRFTRRFDDLPEDERQEIEQAVRAKADPVPLGANAFRLRENDSEIRSLFERGLVYFQDAGSVLVADALGVQAEDRVLDVCAAPGSKTGEIARNVDPSKGLLVACDLHAARAGTLAENCSRQGIRFVNVSILDAEDPLPFEEGTFDRVLVDAPCTGTGTIAQNPEIRYRISKEDLERLPEKQLAILRNASKAVKSGGTLLYSTCSLEPEENRNVADEFLAGRKGFEAVPPALDGSLVDDRLQAELLPHRHGVSGFFIASFRRSE